MEAALADYKTGTNVEADFGADEWSARYDYHLDGLQKLKKKAPTWTENMQRRLFEEAWYMAFKHPFVHCLLIITSEHAKITVSQTVVVENTDVDLIDFDALENSVN